MQAYYSETDGTLEYNLHNLASYFSVHKHTKYSVWLHVLLTMHMHCLNHAQHLTSVAVNAKCQINHYSFILQYDFKILSFNESI